MMTTGPDQHEPTPPPVAPGDEGGSRATGATEAPSRVDATSVAAMLEHTIDVPLLAEAVGRLHAADAADALETLDDEEAVDVIEQMDEQAAADALAEMQTPLAVTVIEDLLEEDPAFAGRLMELMAPDDAVDLLQALDDPEREHLLRQIEGEPADELFELSKYDEESAGGLMTTDFLALREDMTVREAIEFIRSVEVPEDAHHALVTDDTDHLAGIIGLRTLLLAQPDDRINQHMDRELMSVPYDMDRELVARQFDRYNSSMLPVVDERNRLLGVVTVDDVIDIIRQEQTEDVQTSVGAGKGEAVYSSLPDKFRGRVPWLLINLFTSSVAAIIVLQFEVLIAELAVLAVLMPVIANQAGNAGQQSLAVTLRGIVLEEVRGGRILPLLLREALVGLVNGLIAGLLVAGVVTLLAGAVSGASWKLGLVAAISLPIALGVGCFVGTAMPLLMWRYGRDPATGSTIFLTMVTDSFSFLVFLGLALALSDWLGIG